jgi:hypothetical protein
MHKATQLEPVKEAITRCEPQLTYIGKIYGSSIAGQKYVILICDLPNGNQCQWYKNITKKITPLFLLLSYTAMLY